MEDNFTAMRSEAIIKNNYSVKQARNKTAKDFIYAYVATDDKGTIEVKKAACLYNLARRGTLNTYISDAALEGLTEEDVTNIYKLAKQNSTENFKKFYESYTRKIEKGYFPEFIENALSDLKVAYSAYRKANNPLWDLQDSQITEAEMKNLYCILVPSNEAPDTKPKIIEEK